MPTQPNKQPTVPAPTVDAGQPVALKKAPVENKQATWAKIEAVFNAAKIAYLTKGATLINVLDSLASTLTDIKNAETQGMGGLGQGQPEMELPAAPAPEEAPTA